MQEENTQCFFGLHLRRSLLVQSGELWTESPSEYVVHIFPRKIRIF